MLPETAIATTLVLATMSRFQARLILGRPTRIRRLEPGPHAGAYTVTQHWLERSDGTVLEGWCARPALATAPRRVMHYYGGRNENTAWAPHMCSWLPGYEIWAWNYRGSGRSTGTPTERLVKNDCHAAFRYAMASGDREVAAMALMGRSIGTTIATWLARDVKPQHLVLASPLLGVQDVLRQRRLRLLDPLLNQTFDCSAAARAIQSEVLVLLAAEDQTVTHDMSMRFARQLRAWPSVSTIPGTDHRSLPRAPDTQRRINEFILGRSPTV